MTRICITGAAGNLGLLTARHLLAQRPGRVVGLVLHCVSSIYKTPI